MDRAFSLPDGLDVSSDPPSLTPLVVTELSLDRGFTLVRPRKADRSGCGQAFRSCPLTAHCVRRSPARSLLGPLCWHLHKHQREHHLPSGAAGRTKHIPCHSARDEGQRRGRVSWSKGPIEKQIHSPQLLARRRPHRRRGLSWGPCI